MRMRRIHRISEYTEPDNLCMIGVANGRNMAVAGHSRFTCRICLAETDSKHAFALFSSKSLREDWPRRTSELLKVSMADEEDLPRHFCKNCKAKVLALALA